MKWIKIDRKGRVEEQDEDEIDSALKFHKEMAHHKSTQKRKVPPTALKKKTQREAVKYIRSRQPP